MAVGRCPDCHRLNDCETCGNSRYVERNSWGRIIRPATPEEFFAAVTNGKRPAPRPSPQGYRSA